MNYKDYAIEDFLTDEFFLKWVKFPDEESDRFWKHWIANHPEKREELHTAAQLINTMAYEKEYHLEESSRNKMISNILEKANPKRNYIPAKKVHPFSKVAAAILILVLAGISFLAIQNYQPEEEVKIAQKIPDITKSTASGQKLSITLSDGSKIKLNANSEVSFPRFFSGSERVVKVLKGEVFFDVVKMPDKPFIVQTGDYSTRVLGTTFNVNYNKTSGVLDVALVTGNVEITEENGTYRLLPSERLNLNKGKVEKSNFDPLMVTGWKDGILVFDKLSFSETITKLEEWYGVQFEVKKKPKGIYSGVFENESLDNVLNGLGFTISKNFYKKSGNIILK
ncbi:FecR family protein [Flexithrix dorotheae]|uniref:FecR family protein n=1 Tax=Flexithrix dorotheae TaxID=70993 RepID=UPI000364A9CE|nr:FecR domain-containing protein [Flexithrix dorotheae]